ncbi:4-(cytidine 5'-diphospho)-2-C-methyl-D-erythritol kinase [Zavarzinia sp.]|uniref:4-(cytidine 5'-diphospho)-2-C-methyl-D-erythritol kinase n=1 Tax=Zavarzinia sp. TaxID=2027920 RepID=UPI003566B940
MTEAVPAIEAASAPAKINLYLHVTGRRADGYHCLESLVAFAEAGDRIEALPAETLSVTITGPFAAAVGGADDNLVMRAALALRDALGIEAGAALRLDKRLPVAAGLGGGSADAAATLRLLQRLWGKRLEASALHDLALRLGADVPVCLAGRPAHMAGIGEEVTPIVAGLPACGIVLVNPGVCLATPAVFRALAGRFGPADRLDPVPADLAGLVAALAARRNDLEAPAIEVCPAVAEVLALLRSVPGVLLARMSGSGATCFGICADRASASDAAEAVRRQRPDWWAAGGGLWNGREAP